MSLALDKSTGSRGSPSGPPAARAQLFVNGKVFTGTGENDFATAFRIERGIFTWVGQDSDVVGESATDLSGRTVLPGLLDVHAHPALVAGLANAVSCLPPHVDSLAALLDALRGHPNMGKAGDLWIEGYGFDESRYPEQRKPTARDLDLVSTTQPVIVRRCDGHSIICNRRALELAGISRETPDLAEGRIGRHPDGEPNGSLHERAAMDRVLTLIPPPSRKELAQRLAQHGQHLLERGIVGVCDLMATMAPEPLLLFRDAESIGLIPQCALYYAWQDISDAPPELTDDDRTGRIKVAGVKLVMDGAYSDRTAWTHDAYPGTCEHGIRVSSDEDVRRALAWARQNRVQVAVHAMGDRALSHVVDLVGDEEPWLGELPSVRLEHATLFPPELIDRVDRARMNFAVISHSIFFFAEYDSYARNLSDKQLDFAYPIKSFYERIPCTALASDSPATSWQDADDVFVSIKAAVLRKAYNDADFHPGQAVTASQALLLYTGRARLVAPLDGTGLIRPGSEGSFVVLDRDVFAVASAELDQVRIAETWIRGESAYRRA